MVVKLVFLQINKILEKELQTPINLAWTDNVLLGHIGSCNVETISLPDNINLGSNSDNKKMKTLKNCKKQQSTIGVYHQNITGLKFKIDELLSILCPDFPHVLC
jgi:hypothetical protein